MSSGHLTSTSVLLKVCQIVVGITCFGLFISSFYKLSKNLEPDSNPDFTFVTGWILFSDITVVMFLIHSIISIISIVGLGLVIDDVVYNVIAVIFYEIASIGLLVHANSTAYKSYYEKTSVHGTLIAAGIIGILNGLLYAASVLFRKPATTGYKLIN
ncbi:uncharacterized protein LOC129566091 [Sitodiplosis mosellana]|uniref:uncharacterized protein LOC129566091 n=1 Tax=Sitodiplosis mosellana TaxID=263140 RepID=UPI002445231A|nr:uncharacterized protein LOC129566091 [Sitodiplosis mosellana]